MKLPIFPTQEIGSFRKPEYLFEAWRRYLDGEAKYSDILPTIEKASIETIKLLEDIGLDIVWDGEMHRWEMYHYPVEYIDGIEFVGQVRVFDNRYFPKGRVVKKPVLIKNYHIEEYQFVKSHASKPVKIPITGPYTLADWTYNEYYMSRWRYKVSNPIKARYNAKREFTLDLAKNILNPILKELSKRRVFRIQIDEPAATTHPSEMPIFVEAFNKAVDGVKATVTIHICYSDYRILLQYLHDIKTKQYALEFANRDTRNRGLDDDVRRGYTILKEFKEYGFDRELGLGVIDVHTDFIEPVELILDRIKYALKYIEPDKLFINPDCGLRTRSREIAAKKLRNMVEAVKIIRKEYGYSK